jgi:hypothetical protein
MRQKIQTIRDIGVIHQSRKVGTARRAVRGWFVVGRTPRRGVPAIPRPAVTDPLHIGYRFEAPL